MKTRIVETTNELNWGKFLVGWFDHEWSRQSLVDTASSIPLLRTIGWGNGHVWVLDLQTGEGAYFLANKNSRAAHDLQKHKIWVCPMFEPFLEWLYQQAPNWADLPELVKLDAPFAFRGYRREGPDKPAQETETTSRTLSSED